MILITALLGIESCSLAGPPPNKYVLSTMFTPTAMTVSQTGLPIVEVKHVQLPDYLDTTDILERRGNQLVPSSTGRWGERLSLGMTSALTNSLRARLPRMIVTSEAPPERPALQIFMDASAFESRAGQEIVFVAHWTVADGASRQTLVEEQMSIVEPIEGTGDSAVVTAMSRCVEHLTDRLAAAIGVQSVAGRGSYR